MVNTDYVGRQYAPTEPYAVNREKIREFAAALGAEHPAHHDVAAARALGYSDVVAPPTFAVLLAQRAEAQFVEDPAAGIDFRRVVHAEERFSHDRPIIAGEELVTVLHVESIRERAGLAMVTTRCEIFCAVDDGRVGDSVSTVRSTLAVRGEQE